MSNDELNQLKQAVQFENAKNRAGGQIALELLNANHQLRTSAVLLEDRVNSLVSEKQALEQEVQRLTRVVTAMDIELVKLRAGFFPSRRQ